MLYAATIGFGIWGFMGHSAAWAAAALSFFAATMIIVGQQKKKGTKS